MGVESPDMKKCTVLSLLMLAAICGCESAASKPRFTKEELARIPLVDKNSLPKTSGGMSLSVAGDTVTSAEIIEPLSEYLRSASKTADIEQFKQKAIPEIEQVLLTKISNILIYQEARKDAGDQIDDALEKAVETEIRRFITGFNSDYAEAEKELKKMGMDWRSYREYQKKMLLSQSYIASKMPEKRPITHNELLKYYNDVKDKSFTTPAMIQFRLIDIEPAKLELTDPNEDRPAKAKKTADEIMLRLKAGEDFASLAKQYSYGLRSQEGGLWKPVQPDSLAAPYDVLAAEAGKISPGRIAGPIEVPGHVFIMRLEEKQAGSVEPLDKVQKQIEEKIRFERRKKVIDEITSKLLQKITLYEKEKFITYCADEIYKRNGLQVPQMQK